MHLFAIPRSLNVERVTLALGYKGLPVEISIVDPRDRARIRDVSGQELVPVLVDDDGTVVFDSPVILEHIERRYPEPALWPEDPARRAELDVFVDWFNRVWKGPPNAIEAERRKSEPDWARTDQLGHELGDSREVFEALLAGRDYLFGELSAADYAAFPFLKYGAMYDDADTEAFHLILCEHLWLGGEYPRLQAWIHRVDAHPRA